MHKFKIQTLNQISQIGLGRLPAQRYQIGGEINEPDAILVRSQKMHDMTIPSSVRAIGRAGAGTNNIPVAAMTARGIPVFNAPGANANAVKELVLASLLMAARNILPAMRFVESLTGDDASMHKAVEAGKKQFAGIELPNRWLGIIGLGAIGGLVADAALRLGMRVSGFDPGITVEAAWRLSAQVKQAQSIEEIIRSCEFITLHVPLLDATRSLINAERLAQMRPGAVLLNFSREGIVDDQAVREALDSKRLAYYMCDFPSNALKGHPNVLALPHLGASTLEAEENCAVMVVDQVRDFLENGNVMNAVNFPNVEMGRESDHRIAIANANVPNMLGQISTAVAQLGLNIHNMVNKSKGEMAYTLVDLDSPPSAGLCEKIGAIPGVLAVRALPRIAD